MISNDRLLLEAGAMEPGFFVLSKPLFLVEGQNHSRVDRCDNLTITGQMLSVGTEYEGHSHRIGAKSDYSDYVMQAKHIRQFEHVVFFPPHFIISYLDVAETDESGSIWFLDFQTDPTPSTTWVARSIYQLFKNMREWSFMVDEPFNLDHPMAIYSKKVFNNLDIPQEILEEIDAMPDMHLAKFLKGENDFKLIPQHPVISDSFKTWVLSVVNKYPHIKFEDQI